MGNISKCVSSVAYCTLYIIYKYLSLQKLVRYTLILYFVYESMSCSSFIILESFIVSRERRCLKQKIHISWLGVASQAQRRSLVCVCLSLRSIGIYCRIVSDKKCCFVKYPLLYLTTSRFCWKKFKHQIQKLIKNIILALNL